MLYFMCLHVIKHVSVSSVLAHKYAISGILHMEVNVIKSIIIILLIYYYATLS